MANLNTASYKSATGSFSRTLGARADDAINVKDFGARGDGITDDTTAIQSAFDAAFGTWASPNGLSYTNNKAVFFPGGSYLVRSAVAAKTVSGAVDDGVGAIKLTLNNTTDLATGDIVYVRGVGGVPNANLSYTITVNDSTHITLTNSAFGGSYTTGGTVRPPCLRIKDVHGGKIFGSGKGTTNLFTDSTKCAVISTNGWHYSNIYDMAFSSDAEGIAFDLNGDGQGVWQTQSSMFTNCSFGGSAATNGDYGCAVGMGQEMGSEITFVNCFVATGTVAGLSWHNFNALQGTVIGGNFQIGGNPSSGVSGIYVAAGSCPIIHGVGFQHFTGTDINITNGSGDAYCITGCRTESENFVVGPSVSNMSIFIGGCAQTVNNSATGYFYTGGCSVTIDCCTSAFGTNKYVSGQNADMIIRNSIFTNTDYWYGGAGENYHYLEITPQPIIEITDAAYTTLSRDGGILLRFNRATAQTVTVPKNSDATNRLNVGAWIDCQQIGAGKVTFQGAAGVTVNSRGGLLSCNGQYAQVRLTCTGADTWTLSGDIAA